jgi:hypothetical protein
MEHVPASLGLAFGLVALVALALFWRAAHYSRRTLGVLLLWVGLQSAVALSGFYTVTNSLPPRTLALVAPLMLLLLSLLATARGRRYLDELDLKSLTLLHAVRAVPELMTFAGRNWDILSGLSAPVVYVLAFKKQVLGRRGLLVWNVVALGLLLNIVGHALLSVPGATQRLAFEQPNVAILHFPFHLLPALVVPLVLLAHVAALRQLARPRSEATFVVEK